jgi:hypothetical protein
MKPKTAKFITATLTLILIILLTSAFNKQQGSGNKYLTMRTFQAAMGGSSKIMIVYEDGKTEEIELEKYSVSNFLPNTVKINKAINDISNKGYELFSVTGAEMVSLYTFIKKY